jgi:predicted nucleic acid-binding protein
MKFGDLVVGDAVFIDANVLTYHFQPHPTWGPPCADLLRRIENQELAGFTSTHALSEVSHRLMTIQASVLLGCRSPASATACAPTRPPCRS